MFNSNMMNIEQTKPQELTGTSNLSEKDSSQPVQKSQECSSSQESCDMEQKKKNKKKRQLNDLTEDEIQLIYRKNKNQLLAQEEQAFVQCSKIKVINDEVNQKYWLRFSMDRYYVYDSDKKTFVDPFNKGKQFETAEFADFLIKDVFKMQQYPNKK